MKFIFGSVVGRKFQKVSHKIAKVRCTKKEEHIILENMHEPIIDIETWNKAQDKLNGYSKTRNRKYNHQLKGLVYCGECGNKATLRCREEKMEQFGRLPILFALKEIIIVHYVTINKFQQI